MAGLRPALALTILMALPASAAAHPAAARVGVPEAVDAACTAAAHSGPGTATRSFTARRGGYLTARLDAAGGDWDLAVFRRRSGTLAAASAYRGAHEVASGFVRRGEPLTLRACRRSGDTASARVRIVIRRVPEALRRVTVVRVRVASVAARRRLDRLGFDVAGHGRADHVTVLLHNGADRRRLRAAGFSYRRVRTGARAAVRARAAALPSGRPAALGYRRLADYGNEMKALAAANPDLVRPITLPLKSHLGRPVEGLEITTSPNARDGKPVYLQIGMHHAREWPSSELTLEFAYDLIAGYRSGIPRTRSLVDQVRTIVVPVVNPDGFNFSREAGELAGHGSGHEGFDGASAEYHRKNCTPSGCAVNAGVDLNRNYGDRWGGPGSSATPTVETYRGAAPFSEPEAQDVRELIASRQVVVMITNHTFGNEILHQPGLSTDPLTPDESSFNSLGAAMAAENGYENTYSWHVSGDHVGTTDGWSYYTTGGLGYVFEISPAAFHTAFANVIADYDGSAVPGGGTREAFFIAMQAAANPALHSVLTGSAPPGAILRLSKSFTTATWTSTIPERLESTMEVPGSGRFEWHVNQSARPLVAGETWTLTCERPEGTPQLTQEVEVKRGETRELDLSPCGPPPPLDTRPRPSMAVKLAPRFDGRRYRVRVSGRLLGVQELWRCDGAVKIAVKARSKQLGKRAAAGLDERCAFSRRLTFRKRALPRGLRRRGARLRLNASATWNGSEFLAPASATASARVRRGR